MKREKLLEVLRKNLKNENLVKHSLAVEAIMRKLAERFGKDTDKWGVAGLMHDIDLGKTRNTPKFHGVIGAQMLEKMGFPGDITYAVKAHNPMTGTPRKTLLDKALYSADPVSGLITACALVKGKKLSNVDTDFVLKRFKEKRFASGANREQIAACSEIGLSIEEFVEVALDAMKSISKELGL